MRGRSLAVVLAVIGCSVAAGAAVRPPVQLTEPTSIELEPSGMLLVVENSPGRLLRVDPASGRVQVILAGVDRPYSVVRTPAGRIVFSAGRTLRAVVGHRSVVLADAPSDIGPVAAAKDGAIYFSAGAGLYRFGAGAARPVLVRTGLSSPHGVAVTTSGRVLVSDTGNNRIVAVDVDGTSSTFAHVNAPRGLDVASDGSVNVVDGGASRVLHLSADGARRRYLQRTVGDLYDVQSARGGSVYVLEAGETGYVRKLLPGGRVTTI